MFYINAYRINKDIFVLIIKKESVSKFSRVLRRCNQMQERKLLRLAKKQERTSSGIPAVALRLRRTGYVILT